MSPQQPNSGSSGGPNTISVDCAWSDIYGKHTLDLEEPIYENGIGVCPVCANEYRTSKGPPVSVRKREEP
jgi:hypothetical protein